MTYNTQCQKLHLTEPVYGKMKRIKVYLLDEPDTCHVLNINPRNWRSWSQVLKHITETLKPAFGAVLRMYDLASDKFVENFDQLIANRTYVALGMYGMVKKTPGRYTLANKREVFKPRERTQLYLGETDPKMQDFLAETERKGLTVIYVMTNGVTLQVPQKVVFRKHELRSWDPIIRFLDKKLDIPEGVERISTIFGDILLEPRELQHGFVYVALQPLKPFVELDYLELFKYLCSNYRGNYILSIEPAPMQTSEAERRKTRSTVEPITSFTGKSSRVYDVDIDPTKSMTSERKISMAFKQREPSISSKRATTAGTNKMSIMNTTRGARKTVSSNIETSTISADSRISDISQTNDMNAIEQRTSGISARRKSAAKFAIDDPTRPSTAKKISVVPRVAYVDGRTISVTEDGSSLSQNITGDDDNLEEELADINSRESAAPRRISIARASQTYQQSKSPTVINEEIVSPINRKSTVSSDKNYSQSVVDPNTFLSTISGRNTVSRAVGQDQLVSESPTSCPIFRDCDCSDELDTSSTKIEAPVSQKRSTSNKLSPCPIFRECDCSESESSQQARQEQLTYPVFRNCDCPEDASDTKLKRATGKSITSNVFEKNRVESVVSARGDDELGGDDSPTYCPVYKNCKCSSIPNREPCGMETARRNTYRPSALQSFSLDCNCQVDTGDITNSATNELAMELLNSMDELPVKQSAPKIRASKLSTAAPISEKKLPDEDIIENRRSTVQSRRRLSSKFPATEQALYEDEFDDNSILTTDTGLDTIESRASQISESRRSKRPTDIYEDNPEQTRRSIFKHESRIGNIAGQPIEEPERLSTIQPIASQISPVQASRLFIQNCESDNVSEQAFKGCKRSKRADTRLGSIKLTRQSKVSQNQRRIREIDENILPTAESRRSTFKAGADSNSKYLANGVFDGNDEQIAKSRRSTIKSRFQSQMSQAQRRSTFKQSIIPSPTEDYCPFDNIFPITDTRRGTRKTIYSTTSISSVTSGPVNEVEFNEEAEQATDTRCSTVKSNRQSRISQDQRCSTFKDTVLPTENDECEDNIEPSAAVRRSRSPFTDPPDDSKFRRQSQISQAKRRSTFKSPVSIISTDENIEPLVSSKRITLEPEIRRSSKSSVNETEFIGEAKKTADTRHCSFKRQSQISPQDQRRSTFKRLVIPVPAENYEFGEISVATAARCRTLKNEGLVSVSSHPTDESEFIEDAEQVGDTRLSTIKSKRESQMPQTQRCSTFNRSIIPLPTEEYEFEENIVPTPSTRRSTVKSVAGVSRKSLAASPADENQFNEEANTRRSTTKSKRQSQTSRGQIGSTFTRSINPFPPEDHNFEENIVPTPCTRRSTVKSVAGVSRKSLAASPADENEYNEEADTRRSTIKSRRQSQTRSTFARSINPLPTEDYDCEENIVPTPNTRRSFVKSEARVSRKYLAASPADENKLNEDAEQEADTRRSTFISRRQSKMSEVQRRSSFKAPFSILPTQNNEYEEDISLTFPSRQSTLKQDWRSSKFLSTVQPPEEWDTAQMARTTYSTINSKLNSSVNNDPECEDGFDQTPRSTNSTSPSTNVYPDNFELGEDIERTGDPRLRPSQIQRRSTNKPLVSKPRIENCECDDSTLPSIDPDELEPEENKKQTVGTRASTSKSRPSEISQAQKRDTVQAAIARLSVANYDQASNLSSIDASLSTNNEPYEDNEDTKQAADTPRSTIESRLSQISQNKKRSTNKVPISRLLIENCENSSSRAYPADGFPPNDCECNENSGQDQSRSFRKSVSKDCPTHQIISSCDCTEDTFTNVQKLTENNVYPSELSSCECERIDENLEFLKCSRRKDQTKIGLDKSASCPLVSVRIFCKEQWSSKSSEEGICQSGTSNINQKNPSRKQSIANNENQSENTGTVAKYVCDESKKKTCGTVNRKQCCTFSNPKQSPKIKRYCTNEEVKCTKNVTFCQSENKQSCRYNENILSCSQNSICPTNVRSRSQTLSCPCYKRQDEQEPPVTERFYKRSCTQKCITQDIVLQLQFVCNKDEEKDEEKSVPISCRCKEYEEEPKPEPQLEAEFEEVESEPEEEPGPEPSEFSEPEEEPEPEPEELSEPEEQPEPEPEEQPEPEPEEEYESYHEVMGLEPEIDEEPNLENYQDYEEVKLEPMEEPALEDQRISNKGPMPTMTTSPAFIETETRSSSCTCFRRMCCSCNLKYFRCGS